MAPCAISEGLQQLKPRLGKMVLPRDAMIWGDSPGKPDRGC
jgi:hypothetical protein